MFKDYRFVYINSIKHKNESCAPPPIYIDYWFSTLGRAASFRKNDGRLIHATINGVGYYRMNIYDGRRNSKYLHRLVMESFIGACPPNKQVNHKDGNKGNNALANLEYVTPRENINHRMVNGLSEGLSPLNANQIIKIRSRYKEGETQQFIADYFSVDNSTISRIVNHKTWSYI